MGNQNFNMGPQQDDHYDDYGYDNEDYNDEMDDDMGYGNELYGPSSMSGPSSMQVMPQGESPFTNMNLNLKA